jgi:site-specific recombinase XerD
VDEQDIEGFEKWLMEKGRSPFTSSGYKRDVEKFSRWLEARKGFSLRLENISVENVEAYREHLLVHKGASPRTFNRGLAAIRAYLAWAREEGKLIGDSIQEVKMLAEDRDPPRSLEVSEIKALTRVSKRLIRTVKTPVAQHIARRDHAMITLLIDTGMRLLELCMLDLSDIHLTRKKGIIAIGSGASSRSRSISLEASTCKALRSWLEVRPKAGSDAVFTNMWNGDRLGMTALESRIKRIGEKAGVNVTIHVLRHSVVRKMIEDGNTIGEVAGRLGIKDVYYVARTYRGMDGNECSEDKKRVPTTMSSGGERPD